MDLDYHAANFYRPHDATLIVPDPTGGVLARTNENASGAFVATGLIPATGTSGGNVQLDRYEFTL